MGNLEMLWLRLWCSTWGGGTDKRAMAAQAYRESGPGIDVDMNGDVYRKTNQSTISISL
jgi:hypothetical protein